MTSLLLLILLVVAVNMIIGAVVWMYLDCRDERIYRWYSECPKEIGWFACPLFLSCWPVGIWLRCKGRI